MIGLDYAGGIPGGAAIAAAGYGFVVRYLNDGGPSLPGKLLTPGEAADLRANNVDIVSNCERWASRMAEGYAAGVQDAQAAWAQHKLCGGPDNRPIYFSADWDVQPAELVGVFDYLRGAASVIGAANVGIYGGFRAVSEAMNAGRAAWGWQTDAWSGWPVRVHPAQNIHQRIATVTVNGVACDVNDAIAADFGQWSLGGDPSMSAQDVAALSARFDRQDARLDQIVSWLDANFKGVGAQADHNRDLLAGFTQSTVTGAVKAIPAQVAATGAVGPTPVAVVDELAARLAPKAGA